MRRGRKEWYCIRLAESWLLSNCIHICIYPFTSVSTAVPGLSAERHVPVSGSTATEMLNLCYVDCTPLWPASLPKATQASEKKLSHICFTQIPSLSPGPLYWAGVRMLVDLMNTSRSDSQEMRRVQQRPLFHGFMRAVWEMPAWTKVSARTKSNAWTWKKAQKFLKRKHATYIPQHTPMPHNIYARTPYVYPTMHSTCIHPPNLDTAHIHILCPIHFTHTCTP